MNNIQMIEKLYDSFSVKDLHALEQICHNDISWHQCPGFPGGAVHRGIQSVLENVYEGNRRRWKSFTFSKHTIFEGMNNVVVEGTYDVESHNGKKTRAQTVHIFKIKDDKVQSFWQYTDTQVLWSCLS